MCSERALTLYILGIGLGRWAIDIHGTASRQCCRRAPVVWTVSWIAMSDSRPYRWRPPEVTREGQSMLRYIIEGSGRILHEPINGVDINVLYNPTEVYVKSVL